ncbi:MAG: 4Fe-4S dicluster domain-containing protein [Bacteroidaceae bacterium]|nr:4Fe-4S dicluster domain-containing protein [Bacteroidaceae bacterium]
MGRRRKSVLRIVRIVLAIVSVVLMTVLFASRYLGGRLAFLAKAQFVPALLSANIAVLLALLLITFLFGRLYCSVICPLGILQDFFNWIAKKIGGKKRQVRFSYSRPHNVLRYVILALYALAVIFGVGSFMALLDPYAAFGRIMTHIFVPVSVHLNNLLASVSDLFLIEPYVGINSLALSVAIVTFLLVAILAVRSGRTYCNTICPVGSLLGLVSRHSVFKVRIDDSKCVECGLCGKKCRASCIDTKNRTVDYSRCVDCLDCIDNCGAGAIYFSPKEKVKAMDDDNRPDNESRRKFLSILALTGIASSKAWAREKIELVDDLVGNKPKEKHVAVSPFGSVSHKRLNGKCTACHLCIDRCPMKVLRPAINEYGLEGIMQPVMDYTRSFCDYDCTLCGEICPSGAISPLSWDDKHAVKVGLALFTKEDCAMHNGKLFCEACLRACRASAITLVPDYNEPLNDEEIGQLEELPSSTKRPRAHYRVYPKIDPDLCIGCGACQYRCPEKAITVQGFEVHK